MKKLLALILALAMLFTLAACGGGTAQEQTSAEETADTAADESAETPEAPADETADATPETVEEEAAEVAEQVAEVDGSNPVGTYKAIAMVSEDQSVDEATMKQLESAGMIFSLQMKEDGTGTVVIYGEESEFTWADGQITVEDNAVPFTLEDGVLTMESDGTSMTFRKVSDDIIELTPETVDYEAQAANLSLEAPGSYMLYRMVNDGEETDQQTLQLMSAMGLTCYILLQEDGTGTIYLFGDTQDLTWSEGKIIYNDEEVPYTLEDHQLVLESDGTVMTLIKISDGMVDLPELDLSDYIGEDEEEVVVEDDTKDGVEGAEGAEAGN